MVYRLILPDWALSPSKKKIIEGEFSEQELQEYNQQHYNIYFLPNYPSTPPTDRPVDGRDIDTFRFVFVDMDLKDGLYNSKDEFLAIVGEAGIPPTLVVDSGNGIHIYWQVSDLTAMSYLHLQRRLYRLFKTDETVYKIFQLMRYPGTINTKLKDEPKQCEELYSDESVVYTCEELDRLLPKITSEDEAICKRHYDTTHKIAGPVKVDRSFPLKFAALLKNNDEVKRIWSGDTDDRSASDYRLGHLMFANGFTKDEAMSVLVNSSKASTRAPAHQVSYAQGIVDKIWTFELAVDKSSLNLSSTVREILEASGSDLKGTRFPCWSYIDATECGFRLGQVIGLVAGVGVGKTAVALNMFKGFVENNPNYEHFFIPLEQPSREIADRWRTMCCDNLYLHDKVHIMSNYGPDGQFRHLSFSEIKEYLLNFQKVTGKKIGAVVIDHIGALKKKGQKGENQDLMDLCHAMKGFAIETNTMLIMQSQAPREKAGIGDLELSKDAAYGTVYFESYCDYLVTVWQPLKRCYKDGAPTVTAFKFCKIRHKRQGVDKIEEDVCYRLYFDPITEHLRELTQNEEVSFDFFVKAATNKRKADKSTDIVSYQSTPWTKEGIK